MDEPILPTGVPESIEELRINRRYLDRQREYREERGIEEEAHYLDIIDHIERIVGPLLNWQKTYAIAAISGRGMEWAQTRGRSHYHIVGLSCTICGRVGGLGVH